MLSKQIPNEQLFESIVNIFDIHYCVYYPQIDITSDGSINIDFFISGNGAERKPDKLHLKRLRNIRLWLDLQFFDFCGNLNLLGYPPLVFLMFGALRFSCLSWLSIQTRCTTVASYFILLVLQALQLFQSMHQNLRLQCTPHTSIQWKS